MDRRERAKLNAQIYEEAAEWFVRFRAEDPVEAVRREFDRWLRKSPECQTAYMEIAALWSEGPDLDSTRKWSRDALISHAIQDHSNLIPLTDIFLARRPRVGEQGALGRPGARHPQPLDPVSNTPDLPFGLIRLTTSHGPSRWRIAAALVLLPVTAALGIWFVVFASPTYATGIGEERSIALDDGSMLVLNSSTKVAVHFSSRERDVTLISGQALCHVAKDPSRPFVLTSSGTQIRAVGTEFDVYQNNADTIVSVVEGRVAVVPGASREASSGAAGGISGALPRTAAHIPLTNDMPATVSPYATTANLPPLLPDGGEGAILVSAGEQLSVTSDSVQRIAHPNVPKATAWTEHEIIFQFSSLSEVVAEFNRYNKKPLVIASPGLDTFHLSGVFSSTDPSSLLQFLRARLHLEIIETSNEIRIEKK